MQWYEILVIVLAVAFVIGVIVMSKIKHKKGGGCCDCSSCALSCSCKKEDKTE